ncbi:hypothetical protein EVAR_46846_1 [Eumeta japonica]|uniref:Uncharacterized protein n=1 Tax=Eumeta variegata TaxID=151549 RepID=A0A4C1XPW4_EUMVA|nr:hypothetical protein EVAR_46846_1 [Eumeta japonica]
MSCTLVRKSSAAARPRRAEAKKQRKGQRKSLTGKAGRPRPGVASTPPTALYWRTPCAVSCRRRADSRANCLHLNETESRVGIILESKAEPGLNPKNNMSGSRFTKWSVGRNDKRFDAAGEAMNKSYYVIN